MNAHAKGTFVVNLTQQESGTDHAIGRMTIDKKFTGDLDATSAGEMLAVGTAVAGSAGYVAMERVSGTLAGREGTFALQHSGTMTRGDATLSVTVVPDSGTGDLAGLSGTMTIERTGDGHRYEFAYALPGVP